MARLSNHKPGRVIIQATNVHLYSNQFDAVLKQLNNPVLESPSLWLSDNIKPITDVKDIKGVFERINPEDIDLVGYKSAAAIYAPMAK